MAEKSNSSPCPYALFEGVQESVPCRRVVVVAPREKWGHGVDAFRVELVPGAGHNAESVEGFRVEAKLLARAVVRGGIAGQEDADGFHFEGGKKKK